jgi:DNA invertase Pin-like site-specific DNA recombinase
MRRIRDGAGERSEHRACQVEGEPRKVIAYVRVSSRSQDADYQRGAIERAARSRGEAVDEWYSDVASGRSMDRPDLSRALEAIATGGVQRLWVWRIDRLTRSGIVDTLTVLQTIRGHGCECSSVADGFALDGPAADVILAVLAWAAPMEREKIAENQAAARLRMEEQGRAWGRPVVATPELIDHAIHLRGKGWTHREIALALNISRSHAGRIIRENEPQAAAEIMPLAKCDPVRS